MFIVSVVFYREEPGTVQVLKMPSNLVDHLRLLKWVDAICIGNEHDRTAIYKYHEEYGNVSI